MGLKPGEGKVQKSREEIPIIGEHKGPAQVTQVKEDKVMVLTDGSLKLATPEGALVQRLRTPEIPMTEAVEGVAIYGRGRIHTNLLIILLKGSHVLTGLRKLSFLHALTHIPVNKGTLCIHQVKLVVQVYKHLAGHMLANACVTEEVISSPNSLVIAHLAIGLDAMLPAVELPADITDLDANLAKVSRQRQQEQTLGPSCRPQQAKSRGEKKEEGKLTEEATKCHG
ncbi:hypothetical protein Celaphus_00015391 [Cervus elaphus hippelaphus]|uniref:Uncharacterized protein n=1 Tax=Cervus elaphus hippelaphus TaxID=46360 RepID=A0A212CST7_CEREH|nr:hypothetical protein Celaphus_00015391 [Cervus elaphus hippelaphus]